MSPCCYKDLANMRRSNVDFRVALNAKHDDKQGIRTTTHKTTKTTKLKTIIKSQKQITKHKVK